MRIHSHNRLQVFFYAISELRYGSSLYGALSNLVDFHRPGDSLAGMEMIRNSSPVTYRTYKRLLAEDARFANQGYHNLNLYADQSKVTAEAWMDSLTVSAEPHRSAPWSKYILDERNIVLTEGNEVAELKTAFPGFEFEVSGPSSRGRYSYGVIKHRFDRSSLPEVPENLEEYLPGRQWKTLEYGPYYYARDNHSHARRSIGIAENGRLYQASEDARLAFIQASYFDYTPLGTPEEILTQAREARRSAIMQRMRAWRTNAEEEARRQEELEKKRNESFQRFEMYRASQARGSDKTMWISTLPFVEAGKGIKSSRRWGIEVETGAGRDLRGVPDQWDSKGDGSLESAYEARWIEPSDCEYAENHYADEYIYETRSVEYQDPDTGEWLEREEEFEVENEDFIDSYDCEYCGDMGDSYDYEDDDCVELVSPILNSMHSKGLRQICEDLEPAPRTDSAGVHVHVEAKDLTVRQIKELVMGYDHIERFLESSYDRRERGYCKRRSARELMQVVRQPEEGVEPRRMQTGDRYVTVNLQALYSHGTIEFRAMGPKYNYDHLIRWAMFCREMLNVFANGATSKHFARAKSWNDVEAIFARYGSEYNFATVGQMEANAEFEDIEVTV